METITLSRMSHRGKNCIKITFKFDNEIKDYVKSFKGVKWSKTQRSFYIIEHSLDTKNDLINYLKKKNYSLNYDSLKRRPKILTKDKKEVVALYKKYLYGLRLSESTVHTYSTFVFEFLFFIDEKELEALTNEDVRLFIEEMVLKKRYSISSHRQLISALKHFAFFYPKCEVDPEALIRPSKSNYLPTVLSKEEVIDLLRVTRNLKHRAILAMLYSAGLRISELINLEWKDIDIDRRQIFIRSAKFRKDRVVILAESFLPLLQNYFMSYQPVRYFAEGMKEGSKYSDTSVRQFLRRSCKRAKIIKRVTPHTLRHSYATHMLENGIAIRHIQDLLGHNSPNTTMIYTHVTRKDLLQIRSPLDLSLESMAEEDRKSSNVLLSQNN